MIKAKNAMQFVRKYKKQIVALAIIYTLIYQVVGHDTWLWQSIMNVYKEVVVTEYGDKLDIRIVDFPKLILDVYKVEKKHFFFEEKKCIETRKMMNDWRAMVADGSSCLKEVANTPEGRYYEIFGYIVLVE